MKPFFRLVYLGSVFLMAWIALPPEAVWGAEAKDGAAAPEQIAFFEKNIRPVLVKECYACHATTAKKIRGGLTLDTRDGLRKGGDTGPALVPGDPRNSLLVKALKHGQDKLKMPPKKKLSAEVIADFEKWIASGAADPRGGAVKVVKKEIDIEKGRKFWSFQRPKRTAPPAVKNAAWPKRDIDRFLLARLEAKGLKPVADADARTLLRRLSFDLTGLPPAPEEVESFVTEYAASSDAALEAVVDRLLASPRFGERWGRHWLDVARYAESSGRANNFAYPHAWRYRDYVIASFNADKPYDQFIREQLAGDLLDARDDAQKSELLTATGFLAIGPKTHNERNRRQFEMDLADEQIDATFQAFQALTAACARCHDHKFDPIPQKDYYALSGIFRSTQTCYGTIRIIQSNQPSPLVELPKNGGATAGLEPLTAERREGIEKQMQDLRERASNITGQNAFIRRIFLSSRRAVLASQLAMYESDGTPKLLAMGVRDRFLPSDSRLYVRGELSQPGETVPRGFPQVVTTKQPKIKEGSGRRELADWIASKDNPLTARVMANRVWLHLIGRGLVATPDNFGAAGQKPSHPALLDHLALSFIEDGWSVKKLIRSIVLSRAYRLSSQLDEKNFETDPDNVYVWRMPKRRLEAEALRDTMLALSGRLDFTPPKGSVVTRNGEGNIGFRFRGGDAAAAETHRTVYLPIVRDLVPEALTLFDFPDPSLIIGERATTTVPAQSLYLMNNPFVIRQTAAMAEKLLEAGDDGARMTRAYLLCYARPPSAKEKEIAQKFLDSYGQKQTRRATWAALCQALFASAEFSHR
ncbi:MAG TPA: PSD1 and planctomycete cytochrome C domain-containing protein [Gemmataceae bacterium]|nr:PSD1 and planctomycete cytochrome C domain-containing protein [Gemmataceae bacterium]